MVKSCCYYVVAYLLSYTINDESTIKKIKKMNLPMLAILLWLLHAPSACYCFQPSYYQHQHSKQRILQQDNSDRSKINGLFHNNVKNTLTMNPLLLSNSNKNESDDVQENIDWDGIGETEINDSKILRTNTNDDTYKIDTTSTQKFVGRTLFSESTTSTPTTLSNRRNNQVSSSDSSNSNFIVDERELQLTSVFERTLPIQVLSLLIALCFTIYIGVSGGITNGSDRYPSDYFDNNIDTSTFYDPSAPEISDYLLKQQEQQQELDNNQDDANSKPQIRSQSIFI